MPYSFALIPTDLTTLLALKTEIFTAVHVRNLADAQNNANAQACRKYNRVILLEKSLVVSPANSSVRQNLSAILVRNSAIAQNYAKARALRKNA
jgi:hypothetical protein